MEKVVVSFVPKVPLQVLVIVAVVQKVLSVFWNGYVTVKVYGSSAIGEVVPAMLIAVGLVVPSIVLDGTSLKRIGLRLK